MTQAHPTHALRSGSEGFLRVLFGLFLAVIAVILALGDAKWFAAVTALMALFAAREWHRLVRSPAQRETADHQPMHVQTAITVTAIVLAIAAILLRMPFLAFAVLAAGAVGSFSWAKRRGDYPFWHAAGVLYIGIPSLALVALQSLAPNGHSVVLGLFFIVWATDTGALVFGKLIGGKKLAPKLSPGKTWAGTIGGSTTAALIFVLYLFIILGGGFSVVLALLFAFLFSFVAHGGDLFESLVKRRFGYKDSGGLIPGHGGVLDRMDSMFAASVVLALLIFGLHLNPLFGGHA
ncbi:MAG TPA: phosphatidate cytidylyltransferase [Rhizomicrobium sp.]